MIKAIVDIDIEKILRQFANEELQYKAVLPPARSIGQMICAFANGKGGTIVLGVVESPSGAKVIGLSEDFHANNVTHKAIDLLTPRRSVSYQYVTYKNKLLYVIKVERSEIPISLEGKIYVRQGVNTVQQNEVKKELKATGFERITELTNQIEGYRKKSTASKMKFLDHYQGILNIVDDLNNLLYPVTPSIATNNEEGKILMRIIFSSCADNFETYLSELLYEIFLANPNTLKSSQQVTVREVLDCTDMQEFVNYWSKKKLNKLQRGSVKGFLNENEQIRGLEIIGEGEQNSIEKILQIRHLYAHRNGVIDEKFLLFFSEQFQLNQEHQLSIDEMINHMFYLSKIVDQLDRAAISKYNLASLD
jgi:hypothetical protein